LHDFEGHNADYAACVGVALAFNQSDIRAEAARGGRNQRGRACMQSAFARNDHRVRLEGVQHGRRTESGLIVCQRDFQKDVLTCAHSPGA
jgi:hypothetical protein